MMMKILDFDHDQFVRMLSNCDRRFAPIASNAAAERILPFLSMFLEHAGQEKESSYFRNLLSNSWKLSGGSWSSKRAVQMALVHHLEFIPDEQKAIELGFSYVLEPAIAIIRASEAALTFDLTKCIAPIEQTWNVADVMAQESINSAMVDSGVIIEHPLVQTELQRIHRDCLEIGNLDCNASVRSTALISRKRSLEEAYQVQIGRPTHSN